MTLSVIESSTGYMGLVGIHPELIWVGFKRVPVAVVRCGS